MIVITITNSKLLNAGPKAKLDIVNILKENFQIQEKTLDFRLDYTDSNTFFRKLFSNLEKIKEIFKTNFYKEDIKIFQYPLSIILEEMSIMPKKNVILFVHDLLETRRNEYSKRVKKEIKFLKKFKYLVVHNDKMKDYLVKNGIDKDKVFIIELFDYLCKKEISEKNHDLKKQIKVVYAGNLIKEKSPFIYQIDSNKLKFKINLYGKGIEKDLTDKISYKGAYSPDELPEKLDGDLGLVWDGNFDESDENKSMKNYTKYNNPHKLSCYIAGEIPVIVWEKSAVADFVDKYNIGYKISNIYDINNLDFSNYNEKLENIKKLSKKVKSGYFTKKVMEEVLEKINNKL